MEVVRICEDIAGDEDREKIIRKYLFPRLLNEDVFLTDAQLLLNDIFNMIEEEEFEILRDQIVDIVGEIKAQEFVETRWKLGECYNCESFGQIFKCKKEHDDECGYSEIGEPFGCHNLFCEDCIFHTCSNLGEDCPAVRCEDCMK